MVHDRPEDPLVMEQALGSLKSILAGIGRSVVAFSGGIDSTLLLVVARDVLGRDVSAVTAVSPSLAGTEKHETIKLARQLGVEHRLVETHEMDDPDYRANDGRRCYYCKRELFKVLGALSPGGGATLLYGAILDDLGDDRPGMKAASEAGARAPLLEAGFDKRMVRDLARRSGLPNWDKPAMACLASRIPHGRQVTASALGQVEEAEAGVRRLGYRQVRVRHHGTRALVELDPLDLAGIGSGDALERLVAAVRAAGFTTVEIDPQGYRQGGAARPSPPKAL